MSSILILNAHLVNEGHITANDIFIKNGFIEKISSNLSHLQADKVIDAHGLYVLPGVIDDQVHFREPGLTHKATIYTEAKAAVAGGTTSFMEMPNTVPNALTQELLEQKYEIAAHTSLANYSFYMGTSNDNIEEILKTNPRNVCGVKIFMGSSTGNMLVDNTDTLDKIFGNCPMLIATHCESESIINTRSQIYKDRYGDNLPARFHPEIRNEEACLASSSFAVNLAKKHNTRLHVLHISTQDEIALFTNTIPLEKKRITAEVCVHHLWFTADDYEKLEHKIKCNPAIKAPFHAPALLEALLNDYFDVIATDHAPHTFEEKSKPYWQSPSGLPLVQHSLLMMLEFYHQGKISLEKIVEKMSHAVVICFQIEKRGFIREGYYADLVAIDLNHSTHVEKSNLHYLCGWSPLENYQFNSQIKYTIVSGHLAYNNGKFDESKKGERLLFIRE